MTASANSPSPAESHDSPWYRKAFGAGYLNLYSHRNERDAARAVDFLRRHAGIGEGQKLLDLCCGPGRHLAQLVPELGRAIGLDLSRDLLGQAARACEDAALDCGCGCQCILVEGDMRRIPFNDASFDVVINLFTSFGYFEDETQNLNVICEVARTLRPGGTFIIDHINRTHLETFLEPHSERRLDDGTTILESRGFNPESRRVEKRVRWIEDDGSESHWIESVRVYEGEEMQSMLADASLRTRAAFGDYDGVALREHSPRMILIAEKV